MRVPRLVTSAESEAGAFYDAAIAAGHEGLMAKSLDAPYEAGNRGASWFKIKRAHTLDLLVLAAEWGHGRRIGKLSNLHLGALDTATGEYVMLGKTFKGLTDAMLEWQTKELLARETRRDQWTVYVRPGTGGRDRLQRSTGEPPISRRLGVETGEGEALPRRQASRRCRHHGLGAQNICCSDGRRLSQTRACQTRPRARRVPVVYSSPYADPEQPATDIMDPAPRPSLRHAVPWVVIIGGAGFAAGFFGPMIFAPDANQGPLVGILISGPGGAILGGLLCAIFRLLRVSAARQWQGIWIASLSLAIVTSFFIMPKPELRGDLEEVQIDSCSRPVESIDAANAYWDKVLAPRPDAARPGWKEDSREMLLERRRCGPRGRCCPSQDSPRRTQALE